MPQLNAIAAEYRKLLRDEADFIWVRGQKFISFFFDPNASPFIVTDAADSSSVTDSAIINANAAMDSADAAYIPTILPGSPTPLMGPLPGSAEAAAAAAAEEAWAVAEAAEARAAEAKTAAEEAKTALAAASAGTEASDETIASLSAAAAAAETAATEATAAAAAAMSSAAAVAIAAASHGSQAAGSEGSSRQVGMSTAATETRKLYVLIAVAPAPPASAASQNALFAAVSAVAARAAAAAVAVVGAPLEGGRTTLARGVLPAMCMNRVRDEGEADVDCGGQLCDQCYGGSRCRLSTDCNSLHCLQLPAPDPTFPALKCTVFLKR